MPIVAAAGTSLLVVVAVIGLLFAALGYRAAAKFRARHSVAPWGAPPTELLAGAHAPDGITASGVVPTTPDLYLERARTTEFGVPIGSESACWEVWWDGLTQTKDVVSPLAPAVRSALTGLGIVGLLVGAMTLIGSRYRKGLVALPAQDSVRPVAGWYPDPSGTAGALRYWDGTRWTDAVTAAAGPTAAPGPPPP